jgi:hypothetical protein
MENNEINDPWYVGTFEGAREAQIRESKNKSPAARIRWACEMSECIRMLHASQNKTPPALNPDRYKS